MRGKAIFSYLAVVAVLFVFWKGLVLMVGTMVLPMPEDAFAGFVAALFTQDFWVNFQASAFRAVVAMAVAWLLGFPMGILMGSVPRVDRFMAPFVFLTYPVPKIVLLPVFLLLLGLGDVAKIAMIALILWYQILVTTRDGVKLIHHKYYDSVRSLGGTSQHIAMEVLIPAALPHGFTALRLGTGVSVAVLFFVESFATTSGLGYLIMDSWGRMDYVGMFVGIFGMSMLGAVLYELANVLERRMCRWQGNGQ